MGLQKRVLKKPASGTHSSAAVGASKGSSSRQPRIWFLRRKVAVRQGQEEKATKAVREARDAKQRWGAKQWRREMDAVLKPFQKGLSWGGWTRAHCRKRPSSVTIGGKQERAGPLKEKGSSAVGEELQTRQGAVVAPADVSGKSGKDSPKEGKAAVGADGRLGLRNPPLECKAAVGADGRTGLRDMLRIQYPCRFLGGGSFGKVYRMSAVPWSAAGEVAPRSVAVKVLSKMQNTMEDEAGLATHDSVRREIDVLTKLAGSPGIVELLSWTEGLFDVHLVFPFYTWDLYNYIRVGEFKIVQPSAVDKMPSICKQLLIGLSRLHELQILHRDLKPLNMLVHVSAVGDFAETRAVLADFGGAIQMSSRAESAQMSSRAESAGVSMGAQSEPTTYQYRAPELFVCKRQRNCSCSTDVWAMGVSIVEMDRACVPFGRAIVRGSQMEDIFSDQLRVLYKTTPSHFDTQVRKDPHKFLAKLRSLKLQEARCLPWGQSRGNKFQVFMRQFFLPSPESRPLASALAQDAALQI